MMGWLDWFGGEKRWEEKKALAKRLSDAWVGLVEHKDMLQALITERFDKHLRGKRISKEVHAWEPRVRYIVTKTIVGKAKADPEGHTLTYDIGFDIEGVTLGGCVTLTMAPVQGDKVLYRASVMKGPNRDAPDFIQGSFFDEDMFSLPEDVASYLARGTFLMPKE